MTSTFDLMLRGPKEQLLRALAAVATAGDDEVLALPRVDGQAQIHEGVAILRIPLSALDEEVQRLLGELTRSASEHALALSDDVTRSLDAPTLLRMFKAARRAASNPDEARRPGSFERTLVKILAPLVLAVIAFILWFVSQWYAAFRDAHF